MKTISSLLCGLVILLFSSYTSDKQCIYARSNIEHIQNQTEKAIAAEDLNMAKFYAYRALTALEKSKSNLKECGCNEAINFITEGTDHLKNATKTTTLDGATILLEKALTFIIEAADTIEQHDSHNSNFSNDVLALNTTESIENIKSLGKIDDKELKRKIDLSLVKFKESLDLVVKSVDCKVAHNYAMNVYNLCDKQLLKPNLSEGKKYYNLRTKEITSLALKEIGDCKD
ncbi:hypothetical protein [Arenibacter latericius]|uniref:hypothetical protein n=1 Tax=Arenibacter latericius TaxID=86104 RepID=UPI0004237775|nr:hypothetical protein [Arenibacter latericius]MDX1365139.1 hypothetical protein [Arenibacter latericius]